jgi:hypothetical protein
MFSDRVAKEYKPCESGLWSNYNTLPCCSSSLAHKWIPVLRMYLKFLINDLIHDFDLTMKNTKFIHFKFKKWEKHYLQMRPILKRFLRFWYP